LTIFSSIVLDPLMEPVPFNHQNNRLKSKPVPGSFDETLHLQ